MRNTIFLNAFVVFLRAPFVISFLLVNYFIIDVLLYFLFDLGGASADLYARFGFWFPLTAGLVFFTTVGGMAFADKFEEDNVSRVASELETEIKEYESSKTEVTKARLIQKLAVSESLEKNISNPVRIAHVEAEGFGIFDECSWMLRPSVNLLLGRNGFGKTYFLRAIITAISHDEEATQDLLSGMSRDSLFTVTYQPVSGAGVEYQSLTNSISEMPDVPQLGKLQSRLAFPGIVTGEIGKVPILGIPDARFITKSRRHFYPPEEAIDLKTNGGFQFARQEPYEDIVQSFLYQIAIDSLKKDGRIDRLPVGGMIQEVIANLTGAEFRFHSVEHTRGAGLRIMVVFESGQTDPVPLQVASQGTLSILAIFGLIWSFLHSVYGEFDMDKLHDLSAIVVIDEVDAHLHPAWQRRIVGLLRRTFPAVQFILTAHSPLVVAGCLEGEVAIFRRNQKTHKLEICPMVQDFIGRDIDEITRTVFEVEEFDETYESYSTMLAQKPRIEERYKELKRATRLSARQTTELKVLEYDLHYLSKFETRSQQISEKKLDKAELERLKIENETLKRKLKKSKQPKAGGSASA